MLDRYMLIILPAFLIEQGFVKNSYAECIDDAEHHASGLVDGIPESKVFIDRMRNNHIVNLSYGLDTGHTNLCCLLDKK